MKKNVFSLVTMIILSLLFTACGIPAESPTDVAESKLEQTIVKTKGEMQEEKEMVSSVPAVEENETGKEENHKDNKTESVVKGSVKEEVTTSQSVETTAQEDNDGEQGEKVSALPVFTSESALRNWLKTGAGRNSVEANLMNGIQSRGNYYYRPIIDEKNDLVSFRSLTVNELTWSYHYDFHDEEVSKSEMSGLIINVSYTDFDNKNYEWSRQKVLAKEEGRFSKTVNGIEYFGFHNTEYGNDVTVIRFKQNGIPHSASIYGHFDQLDEILPLLKVERVNFTVNDNVVTQ
ncbi:MAG: hypothetical protein IKM39_00450 [Clostridia bacterium]|nr:hypothetical protein [Clostridia bacterium]